MNVILNILFPKRCVACGRFGRYICAYCESLIIPASYICPVCEGISKDGSTHIHCKSSYSLDGLVSACIYKGVIKKAIHRYKYQPYLEGLTPYFTQYLLKSIKGNRKLSTFLQKRPIFTSVPLHWYKKTLRGFNQAEQVGREFAGRINCEYKELIVRTKLTKPQSELTKEDRMKNIDKAFWLKNRKLPRNIVVIDDVWTTGITIKQIAKLLKQNRADCVWTVTIAR